MNFKSFKSIEKKISYSFALSLGISLFIAIITSLICVNATIPVECTNVNTFCISFFSTTTTFVLTTIMQNGYELIFKEKENGKEKKIFWNVFSFLSLIAYILLYILYLQNISNWFGIILILISLVLLTISVFSFVETFCQKLNEGKGKING